MGWEDNGDSAVAIRRPRFADAGSEGRLEAMAKALEENQQSFGRLYRAGRKDATGGSFSLFLFLGAQLHKHQSCLRIGSGRVFTIQNETDVRRMAESIPVASTQ